MNDYNTLIKNKNEYLKKLYINSNLDTRYLDILDEKISELGFKICEIRTDYFKEINNYIDSNFKIFKPKSNLKVEYVSDFSNKNKEEILKSLNKQRKRDILNGLSTIGVHRDDYNFIFDDMDAKNFASQGIQKLIVLALKLSELDIFINKYGIYPILLLDDIFSELDLDKRNRLIKYIMNDIQTIITTTDLDMIDESLVNNAKVFIVDNGNVTVLEKEGNKHE